MAHPRWSSDDPPDPYKITPFGALLAVLRALVLVVVVFGGLILLLLLRLVEAPVYGMGRPVTPWITQAVCRTAFWVLGMSFTTKGAPMTQPGAVVANHSSWLDIFALNARKRIYFVSKSEVASWPGIGWLARATGTVFIERNPTKAREQTVVFENRLLAGHKLLFFPEGTSTDGLRVLPFKTTLFASFFTPKLKDVLWIQPVTVFYTAPMGQSPRYYGWWGDMDFGPHLLKTLAVVRQGGVTVTYHAPLKVSDYPDRKALARAAEAVVQGQHAAQSGDR
jgi:1-acyl-sn-glycerol-3-phosphate acyltransferase